MKWKVFVCGKKIAECEHAEDAAYVAGLIGDGASIKFGRHSVWYEGSEEQPANACYDYVAETIEFRASLYSK